MDKEKLYVKKGIERLARVYCWPNDPVIIGRDKDDFDALCEFVLFKEFVMNPFFKSLLGYLFKHIAKFYRYLFSLPMDKTCMLTYKEAFLFMRVLGVEKVKLILEQTSYPSYVFNGILRSLEEDSYDLFFSALDKSDYTEMMQVLWVMRYILLGEKGNWNTIDPSIPYLTLLPYIPGWINNLYSFKLYFEVDDDDDEDYFIEARVIEIVHGRKRKRIKSKRNPFPTSNNEISGESNMKELEKVFEKSLFKSHWKDLLAEFSDISDSLVRNSRVEVSYIEDLAQLILTRSVILHKGCVMEKYGIDSSETYNQFIKEDTYESGENKDFGRYILYYTREMLYIYNKVETVLSNETKEVLNNLLNVSFYSKLLKTKIDSNDYSTLISTSKEHLKDCNSLAEETQFLESGVIEDWKKKFKKYEKKVKTFTICKLNNEEIEKLTKRLVEEEFIEKNTNPERLAHILSGTYYDGRSPIIWIKKEENNGLPSKRTVLNFLRLLGVEWEDLTPKRLNCCFICSSHNRFVPFATNNIKEKRRYNASSEYRLKLKSIIETALGGGHVICKQMDKFPLSE